MKFHSAKGLDSILKVCGQHGILCIADEVMTGFGKTGRNFASEYIATQPDIICLSKALTAGLIPMGLTSCTNQVYESQILREQVPADRRLYIVQRRRTAALRTAKTLLFTGNTVGYGNSLYTILRDTVSVSAEKRSCEKRVPFTRIPPVLGEILRQSDPLPDRYTVLLSG